MNAGSQRSNPSVEAATMRSPLGPRSVAEANVAVKRSLAAQYPDDRLHYTSAKDSFVETALRQASNWA